MRIIRNIDLETIDTFCSILGKEYAIEWKGLFHILIPCYNVGYYENEINSENITKSVDFSIFLFKDVYKLYVDLSLYKNKEHTEFLEEKITYDIIKKEHIGENYKETYLEGFCYRLPSYSYASYTALCKSMCVILIDDKLKEYKSKNEILESNSNIKEFLSGKLFDEKFIESLNTSLM